MRRFWFVCCCLMLLVGLAVSTAWAQEPARKTYIVRFKPEYQLPEQGSHAEVVKMLQASVKKNLPVLKKVIKTDDLTPLWIINGVALEATTTEIGHIKKLPNVLSAKPSRYQIWVPVDTEARPVKSHKGNQWSIVKVKAPEVWNELKIDGTGIVVGHLDTGIDAGHPDLMGKVLAFKDFTPNAKPAPYDDQGHGTHTAGSIAGGNGVGVAPGAKLIVAKVFDRKGGAEDTWLLQAMQWVMDPDGIPETNDGPKLVSNSWGSNATTDRTFWDAVQAWVAAGIVPVFAAGNNGPSGKVGTPAGFPHSWAVAATTSSNGIAYFSSVGPSVWDGITLVKPDIAAPGQGVVSCKIGGGYVSNSGTSMACPHVAGVVALMLQANPALTIDQVRSIAESTALDLGAAGKDTKFGAGLIDALACVKKVLEGASLAPAYEAYEAALAAERALIGVQATTPLSGPLARSLLQRTQALDEGELVSLRAALQQSGSPAARALFEEAARLRKAGDLNR